MMKMVTMKTMAMTMAMSMIHMIIAGVRAHSRVPGGLLACNPTHRYRTDPIKTTDTGRIQVQVRVHVQVQVQVQVQIHVQVQDSMKERHLLI